MLSNLLHVVGRKIMSKQKKPGYRLVVSSILNLSLLFALFVAPLTIHQKASAQAACADLFAEKTTVAADILKGRGAELPKHHLSIDRLAQFAETYNLPYKWVDFGPEDRKVKRLLVAIDATNDNLMTAYRRTFNLDTPLVKGEEKTGTLVIEQTWETPKRPEHYVYTYIRAFSEPFQPVYRWGRQDMNWTSSFTSVKQNVKDTESGLIGIGHLIELNSSEIDNVKIF